MYFQPAEEIPDHPAIEAHPDALGLLWIEGRESALTVLVGVCGDPSCLCRDLLVTLEEQDGEGAPVEGGLQLSTWVDVDNLQPVRPLDDLPPAERILFREALETLPPDLLRELSDLALERKRSAGMLERATIPLEEIRAGILQSWIDLSSDGKSFGNKGGDQAAGQLDLDGREWLIDLLYCPDPSCDCRSVQIYGQAPVRKGKVEKPQYFLISASLQGEIRSIDDAEGCSEAQAREVAEAWIASLADAEKRFTKQYAEVREVAARSLERAPKDREGRKIGRNEACPCGSGKKYKRCCLGKG